MHVSNSVAISMFPYLEVMFENDEVAWEIADFLELEENEIKRFRKRKIPKAVIKRKEKEKEERLIEEIKEWKAEQKDKTLKTPILEEISEKPVKKEPVKKVEPPKEDLMFEEMVDEVVEEEPKKEEKTKQVSLFSF